MSTKKYSLLSTLWETSFTPQHCKGGLQGAGLVPFSPEHVLTKLPPSLASELGDQNSTDEQERGRKVACTSCGHEMPATPTIQTRIVSYFAGILEIWKDRPKIGQRNHLRVRGRQSPWDEFMQPLETQREQKAEKTKKGRKRGAKHTARVKPEEGMHTCMCIIINAMVHESCYQKITILYSRY